VTGLPKDVLEHPDRFLIAYQRPSWYDRGANRDGKGAPSTGVRRRVMDPVIFVVVIAFLGPIIGSIIGVMRRPSFIYVCCMLCFAAGVMLAISFMELIPESIHLSSVPVGVSLYKGKNLMIDI
jgi:hypothetical protein